MALVELLGLILSLTHHEVAPHVMTFVTIFCAIRLGWRLSPHAEA